MTISTLPLSYCTNVHPGRSVAHVLEGLDQFTLPIQAQSGRPLAAGLWLAADVINELVSTPTGIAEFANALQQRQLPCYTLNAFPFGDFHSPRVKENVYLPDWTTESRQAYTVNCARVLAALLPEGGEGSLSTVPLAWEAFVAEQPDFMHRCANRLIATAREFAALKQATGRTIRLALEPEPLCVLGRTDTAIGFFQILLQIADAAGAGSVVREHIGLCYDVCHQACYFEEIAASVRAIHRAGIRINKVHLTCAIDIERPGSDPARLAALKQYVEPRYLHQTFAQLPDGTVQHWSDLEQVFAGPLPPAIEHASRMRVHFHVPVDAERLGPLGTTRTALKEVLAVVRELPYAPHLEVETYTWEVLPNAGPRDIVAGFARELIATHQLLGN